MEQEGGGEPTGGGNTPPAEEPSGLPSDNLPPEESTGFQVKPEDLKDGKYMGKWSNPQEMADYIKNIEDKHANLQRDIKNESSQSTEELAQMTEASKAEKLKSDTIKSLAPEFLNNGMVVTEEMEATLKEAGVSESEIKLGAYEIKEGIDKNASYVGGQENYDIIMDYHSENMTPEEKIQFNHSIQDPANSQALMVGLQAMYEKSLNENPDGNTPDRIRGNVPSNTSAIKPYESKAELFRDKKYADSRNSSAADKAKFRARLNATPENVWRN